MTDIHSTEVLSVLIFWLPHILWLTYYIIITQFKPLPDHNMNHSTLLSISVFENNVLSSSAKHEVVTEVLMEIQFWCTNAVSTGNYQWIETVQWLPSSGSYCRIELFISLKISLLSFKNNYSVGSSVTVDVFETGTQRRPVHAQCANKQQQLLLLTGLCSTQTFIQRVFTLGRNVWQMTHGWQRNVFAACLENK
jgi:hypothetical protein